MTTTNYLAEIANEEQDGTETVDIRTLSTERLQALHVEAGSAGDSALVETIESVLVDR